MPLELALHDFAVKCGRFPWELTEMDPPADVVYRALAIEGEHNRQRAIAHERAQRAQQRG